LPSNLTRFRHAEPSPAERRKLLASLFDHTWQDNGTTVTVKPRGAFVPYFQAATQTHQSRSGSSGVQSGSDGGRTLVRHPIEIRIRSEAVDRLSIGRFSNRV
jgi:hypothetical protein